MRGRTMQRLKHAGGFLVRREGLKANSAPLNDKAGNLPRLSAQIDEKSSSAADDFHAPETVILWAFPAPQGPRWRARRRDMAATCFANTL
jgi:hypothetical protein